MNDARRTALLVVDLQNDFCAGGALAVPNADRVVSALNHYIDEAVAHGVSIYASRDWHPPVSNHFEPYGGPWPVHGVKDTDGARFHRNLRLPAAGSQRTIASSIPCSMHCLRGCRSHFWKMRLLASIQKSLRARSSKCDAGALV